MSERACGSGVLCLTDKKKKREIEGSGSFTRVGRETFLRELFRQSKRGIGVIFPSPVQGSASQANSSSDLPSCTHLCDGSRLRYSHLLGTLCWLLSFTCKKSYSTCFHTKMGDIFPRVSRDRSEVGCPGESSSGSWRFLSKESLGSLVRQLHLWAQEIPAQWTTVNRWCKICEESAASPGESGITTEIALWVRNWPEERQDQVLLKRQVLG